MTSETFSPSQTGLAVRARTCSYHESLLHEQDSTIKQWASKNTKISQLFDVGSAPTPTKIGTPTERSAELLLSLPYCVISEVFAYALADSLLPRAQKTAFFRYCSLSDIVLQSKGLRYVCRSWKEQLQDCLFGGLSARSGLLALVSLSDLPQIRTIFPSLNYCVLSLGDMWNIPQMEQLLIDLQTHSSTLGIIRGIIWDNCSYTLEAIEQTWLPTSKTSSRAVNSYLEHSLVKEILEDLENASISTSNRQKCLTSTILTLVYYHAHLLRNLLAHAAPDSSLTIPLFIMPLLLGDQCRSTPSHFKLTAELESLKTKGDSIMTILNRAQRVQFVGPTNPLIGPLVLDARILTAQHEYEQQKVLCDIEYDHIARTTRFPPDLPWPVRGIGFDCTLEFRCRESLDDWWLRLLDSSLSSGASRSISIMTESCLSAQYPGYPGSCFRDAADESVIDGAIDSASSEGSPQLHFCEQFAKLRLDSVKRLDLDLNSICPIFFQNIKHHIPGISGTWYITTVPNLCPHWVETHLGPVKGTAVADDLAILEHLVTEARPLAAHVNLTIRFTFEVFHLATKLKKSLEIRPLDGLMRYSSVPITLWQDERERSARFTTKTFSSTIACLAEQEGLHDFGLWDILDYIAGEDWDSIKARIEEFYDSDH